MYYVSGSSSQHAKYQKMTKKIANENLEDPEMRWPDRPGTELTLFRLRLRMSEIWFWQPHFARQREHCAHLCPAKRPPLALGLGGFAFVSDAEILSLMLDYSRPAKWTTLAPCRAAIHRPPSTDCEG